MLFAIKIFNSSIYGMVNKADFMDIDLIETGFNKKQRNLMHGLLTLIKTTGKIALQRILDVLPQFEKDKIIKAITKLKSTQHIFQPELKKYQVI